MVAIILVATGVYSLSAGVSPNPGHTIDAVGPPSSCTNGQFLKWNYVFDHDIQDYVGSWSCAIVSASGGGGSGSADSLPLWTSAGTLGESNIYQSVNEAPYVNVRTNLRVFESLMVSKDLKVDGNLDVLGKVNDLKVNGNIKFGTGTQPSIKHVVGTSCPSGTVEIAKKWATKTCAGSGVSDTTRLACTGCTTSSIWSSNAPTCSKYSRNSQIPNQCIASACDADTLSEVVCIGI